MKKPDFILGLEKEKKVFSYVNLPKFHGDFVLTLKEKKYFPVYSERSVDVNGKMSIQRYILKSAQGFFLYFEKIQNQDEWNLTIYFEEDKDSELQFFINNFLKTYKNATTNN